jgi:hypothetical protein
MLWCWYGEQDGAFGVKAGGKYTFSNRIAVVVGNHTMRRSAVLVVWQPAAHPLRVKRRTKTE